MSVSRRDRILAMVRERGSVSLKELEHAFPEVSTMTLRRDLQHLDATGLAIRVRKGARAVSGGSGGLSAGGLSARQVEPVFEMRLQENTPAKDRIAKKAAELIQPGRSIYLDAGTTIARLARLLPDEDYAIITHAPNIALEIAKRQRPTLHMLGGRLVKDNLSLVGESAILALEGLNIDTAVMSASGYTDKSGFTCGNHEERMLKEHVIKKARRTLLLMDKSKLGKSLPLTFATAEDIGQLVIDLADEAIIASLTRDGLTVVQA